MFTPDEKPLLTGSAGEVSGFVDCSRCMVVDWRGTIEEAIDDAVRWLPPEALTYQVTYGADGSATIDLHFRDRRETFKLPEQEQNNFRALLRLARLIQPEYEIKIFRCTEESDTHGFLVRPSEWWTAFRSQYPQRYTTIFSELDVLNELWGLD